MKQSYDLTTKAGILAATALLGGNPIAGSVLVLLKDFFSSNDPDKQSKAVGEIIKAGRDNGAKEMEIITKNTKGLQLRIPYADINTAIGNNGKMIIKIKYK